MDDRNLLSTVFSVKRLPVGFMLLGALPFVVGALALLFHIQQAAVYRWVSLYAAVILSFVGGVDWGLAMRDRSGGDIATATHASELFHPWLLSWSILLPVAGWVLVAWRIESLWVYLSILFLLQWLAHFWFYQKRLLPVWFWRARCLTVPIVVICLLIGHIFV